MSTDQKGLPDIDPEQIHRDAKDEACFIAAMIVFETPFLAGPFCGALALTRNYIDDKEKERKERAEQEKWDKIRNDINGRREQDPGTWDRGRVSKTG